MIHTGRKSQHMVWGAVLGARTLFILPTSASASLGRSGRLRRLPLCITQRNYVNHLCTWNAKGINGTAKREEVVDCFRKGKFELLALTDEIEGEWRGTMVWSKWHYCWCSGDRKRQGRGGHPVE